MIPCGFYILVKPDDDIIRKELGEEQEDGYVRDSGLFIPKNIESVTDIHRERAAQQEGTLVAIGDIAWWDYAKGQHWAKVGDRVVFAKYAGKFINDPVTDELLVLLQDSDIVAKIEDVITETENDN